MSDAEFARLGVMAFGKKGLTLVDVLWTSALYGLDTVESATGLAGNSEPFL
jgi:hypothetical protein